MSFDAENIIFCVNSYLQWSMLAKKILPTYWVGCNPLNNILPHQVRPRPTPLRRWSVIKWTTPPINWVKLNTDGAYSLSNDLAGGGGVIRDDQGTILEGFTQRLTAVSSTDAELQACLIGCEKAKHWGRPVWIETDSQQVVNIATGRDKGAANIRHRVTRFKNLVRNLNCRVTHIHREGNRIADWLAKQGKNQAEEQSFNHDSAPTLVKALAFLDRIGLPSVREVIQDDMG